MQQNTVRQPSSEINERARARGIRNAGSRYNEHAAGRMTQTQLQNPSRRSRRSRGRSRNNEFVAPENNEQMTQSDMELARQNIRDDFRAKGEEIGEEELNTIQRSLGEEPEKTHLPWIMLTIAGLKDTLDILLALSLVGGLFSSIPSVILGVILFIWTLSKLKMNAMKDKKRARRYIIKFFTAMGIEIIPYVNFIPMNTVFVYTTYLSETKMAALYAASRGKFGKLAKRKLRDISR